MHSIADLPETRKIFRLPARRPGLYDWRVAVEAVGAGVHILVATGGAARRVAHQDIPRGSR